MGSTTILVYMYLSFKIYRYKAKLAARNAHAHALASSIRETNVKPLDRRDNQGNIVENETQRRKILIGDKPKSSASHGYILILVSIYYYSI